MPRNLEAVSQFKILTKRSSDRGLCHLAAHHAAFSATAFCKMQLILRRCGCGVGGVERNAARSSAWPALHLSLTLSRLSSGKISEKLLYLFMHSNFKQASYLSMGYVTSNRRRCKILVRRK